MQEFIIKATIIAEPINTSELETGTVAMLRVDKEYVCVTLMHMTGEGEWYVEGDYTGVVSDTKTLFRLSALADTKSYPIILKDWKKLSDKINQAERIDFTIFSYKFKEGKNMQTCSDCTGHFYGAKSQPLCQKCCKVRSMATLDVTVAKPKRKRLVSYSEKDVLDIIEWCQKVPTSKQLYMTSPEELILRYKEQKDGNNIDKKT